MWILWINYIFFVDNVEKLVDHCVINLLVVNKPVDKCYYMIGKRRSAFQ